MSLKYAPPHIHPNPKTTTPNLKYSGTARSSVQYSSLKCTTIPVIHTILNRTCERTSEGRQRVQRDVTRAAAILARYYTAHAFATWAGLAVYSPFGLRAYGVWGCGLSLGAKLGFRADGFRRDVTNTAAILARYYTAHAFATWTGLTVYSPFF